MSSIGIVSFLFIIHFLLFGLAVQIVKKDSSLTGNLGKKIFKYLLITIRMMVKNVFIIEAVLVLVGVLLSLLPAIGFGIFIVLECFLSVFLLVYILEAFLDVLVTSCIVVRESDDMKINDIRERAKYIIRKNKFFSLIYSTKELIITIIILICFNYLQYFIWKPNFVWQDMLGMISGSTYIMQNTSPKWWSIFSTIVISAISGFTLIKLLYLTSIYYDDVDAQEDDDVEKINDMEDKKYLPQKIGMYILYAILLIVFLFSHSIFSSLFGAMHKDEIEESKSSKFDMLLELQKKQEEEKQKKEEERVRKEKMFRENIEFELEGIAKNGAPIIKIINNSDETVSINDINISLKDEEGNIIEASKIVAGRIFVSGTAPCPIVIPANGFSYITGTSKQKEYYLKYKDFEVDYEFTASSNYTHSDDIIIEGLDTNINDLEDKINVEIVNNTGKKLSAINIFIMYYEDGNIVEFKEDCVYYNLVYEMIQPGDSYIFEEEHPESSYDDIKVIIRSAIHSY